MMHQSRNRRRAWVIACVGLALIVGAVMLRSTIRESSSSKHPSVPQGKACADCHSSPHRGFSATSCETCHTLQTWHSVSHRHRIAAMDQGVHAKTPCLRCHLAGDKPTGTRCRDCHRTSRHVYQPGCASCHTSDDWKFAGERPARHVRLRGAHAKLACPDCHNLQGKKTTSRCGRCHTPHTTASRLRLGHADVACVKCHNQKAGRDNLNVASVKGRDCVRCHAVVHAGLRKCRSCHGLKTFKSSSFRHESVWALTGAHTAASCTACHPSRQWARSASTTCASCHRPQHVGLSSSCQWCHTTSRWKPSTFWHASVYPLTGKHAQVTCTACHPGGQWSATRGTTCVACHAKLSHGMKRCESCHTPRGWSIILPHMGN